jgi:hypothetical protein
MRRKAPGQLLKGAHAVEREAQVLQALETVGFPVAHVYGLCTLGSSAGRSRTSERALKWSRPRTSGGGNRVTGFRFGHAALQQGVEFQAGTANASETLLAAC